MMKKLVSTDFNVDQLVTCPHPEGFVSPLDKYLAGRVGVVLKITPPQEEGGQLTGVIPNRVHVRWLKKGNRGKEKTMWMYPRDIKPHEQQ